MTDLKTYSRSEIKMKDNELLIHAIEQHQLHSLASCGVDTTPLDVLSDWEHSKVTCPDCLERVYTPGGGGLNAELAADLKMVNEAIKAGHRADVHGCDLTAAAALDRVCVALTAFTLATKPHANAADCGCHTMLGKGLMLCSTHVDAAVQAERDVVAAKALADHLHFTRPLNTPAPPAAETPHMNRRQRVMAGRCRECGSKGLTPHTDECKWIGGVCEYQLQTPPAETPDGKPCPCGGPMYKGVPMHKLDCPVLHGKPLPASERPCGRDCPGCVYCS